MAPAPPPPARGGGKGLIIGLGGLAAVVLVAIVVVAAQQMKPSEDPIAAAPTAQPTVTQVDPTPTATAEKEPVEDPEPEPVDEPEPEPAKTSKKSSGEDKPKTSGKTTTTPPKTETPPAETAKPAASGGAACSQCISDAQNGNFSSAVANYSACSGDAKPRCANTIRGRAAQATEVAANNSECAKARQIVATVSKVGLGAAAQGKLARSKCQ
jgi:outer membrane biosynthesis protein TonB